MTFDRDYSNVDSMFELSQQLAREHNPIFKTIDQNDMSQDLNKKNNVRPTTMATKKRVTFRIGEEPETSPQKEIEIESMSESLSSNDSSPKSHAKFTTKEESQRKSLRDIRNFK